MYRIACIVALAAALVAGGAARASGPIGVYVIVDKVVLEPADAPTTIQIWGTIALAKDGTSRNFTDPARGYLYYKAPTGREDVCRKEWNEMKKAAGTGEVIWFGDSTEPAALGKVRTAKEKPEAPTDYPLGNGLGKARDDAEFGPIAKLRGLPAPQSPADGDFVPPGEITLAVRNIADKKHAKVKYVFELEGASGGKEEATIEAADKETKWTPKMKVKAGEKYIWRVRAVDGDWKGPQVTSAFTVKGDK
jgi:hypothetical protein